MNDTSLITPSNGEFYTKTLHFNSFDAIMKNLLLRSAILGHFGLSLGVQAARADWPELVLDERVLRISSIAADLSSLAYAESTVIEQWVVGVDNTTGIVSYEHPDYDEIDFYIEEPDQAIVAKKEGRCYLAFRGTNANIDDWLQNAGLGDADIYKDNIDTGNAADSCEARGGFADFLSSGPVARGRADLQDCYDTCADPDDCLVITGHSQGGAISALAAITTFSLNPIVVTFGQPPSVDPDCPFIDNTRFYRYVNWLQDPGQDDDIGFDLVVYAPNWISGSVHYGFNVLVGEDPTNVYYGGFGDDVEFNPSRFDNKAAAHTMSEADYSYQSRIKALLDNLPDIGTDGSIEGTICKDAYMELCEANSCVENQCLRVGGVNETCIKGSCEKDSDCAGDLVCVWDACAVRIGEVEPSCPCRTSSQCFNQDCITVDAFSLDFVCNPNLPNIPKISETCIKETCDLDTDCAAGLECVYGACNKAGEGVQAGCPCAISSQCANRDCITVDALKLDFICNPDNDGASLLSVWSTFAILVIGQACVLLL
jgi:hypothetical protein